jgi:hypothetical protein
VAGRAAAKQYRLFKARACGGTLQNRKSQLNRRHLPTQMNNLLI